jgi:hypothetical protein
MAADRRVISWQAIARSIYGSRPERADFLPPSPGQRRIDIVDALGRAEFFGKA